MMVMYARRLELPSRSFFLFGPRGTGKTTWLNLVLPQAVRFDLLRTRLHLDLMRDPDLFTQQVEALDFGHWRTAPFGDSVQFCLLSLIRPSRRRRRLGFLRPRDLRVRPGGLIVTPFRHS